MATLILNSWQSSAYKESLRIQIHRSSPDGKDREIFHVPFDDVERLIVIGSANLSSGVIQELLKRQVPIQFLSSTGKWRGLLCGHPGPQALRRILQYETYRQEDRRLILARRLIQLKIRNSRRVLQKLASNHKLSESQEYATTQKLLQQAMSKAESASSLDELRGHEGVAAALYFERLADFFPAHAQFGGRNRQPPRDPANAVLSFAYTIVGAELEAAVRLHNLDPYIGFLHELSHSAPSLALDLLEVFRAPLCDLLALRLFNLKQLSLDHFHNREEQGVFLNEAGRTVFFQEYENAVTRRFSLTPESSATDFRSLFDQAPVIIAKFLDGASDLPFYQMP